MPKIFLFLVLIYFFIRLKISNVVNPEKKEFAYPLHFFLAKNHSNNPCLVKSSWPIIDVLKVITLFPLNSPKYFDNPYKSVAFGKDFSL